MGNLLAGVSCEPNTTTGSKRQAGTLSTANVAVGATSSNPARDVSKVTLLAGGDIDLSRRTGQRLLRDPSLRLLSGIEPWLREADLRFANLESPLCELGGRTVSDHNPLVFAGPPIAMGVLKDGKFDILSTANNHAWDFGKPCLQSTVTLLKEGGIASVGTDPEGEDPERPVILVRNGQRFAFFAITAIFNDGPLRKHMARAYLADADVGELKRRIAQVRPTVDWVVVSVHIGAEYVHEPHQSTRYAMFGVVEAGADLVLGHHPHTPQRIEYHRGVPVVMSLGNLVFHENSNHPWTGWGYLLRVQFEASTSVRLAVCPFHLVDAAPKPLTTAQHAVFWNHWDAFSKTRTAARVGEQDAAGCRVLTAPR